MRINIISKEKQIYEERKENGQWQKSIEFKLPIIEKEFTLSLDNDTQVEAVCLLTKERIAALTVPENRRGGMNEAL